MPLSTPRPSAAAAAAVAAAHDTQATAPEAVAAPLAPASGAKAPSLGPFKLVKWWAALGAVFLAFEVAVLAAWVASPLLHSVPTGATSPPLYMKIAIVAFEAGCIPAAIACLYLFAVRPWRKTGRLTTDGALTIAFATMWFGDPLSSYFGVWFTYNSWSANLGSWLNAIPGALAPAQPGRMLVEPLLIIPGVYVWVFVLTMFLGNWVMRAVQARRPRIGRVGLIVGCLVAMWIFDVVFEGLIFMPLGIWEYPGGWLNLFAGTYHQFPLSEMLTCGTLFTVIASLRFFRNSHGETVAEHGIHLVKASNRAKDWLRVLAMIGVANLALIVCYNLPNSLISTHVHAWPQDIKSRTYLNDGICGTDSMNVCYGADARAVKGNQP
jgi:hypothetical protein